MLTLDIVSDFIFENFERVSSSKSGTHFNFKCPYCGDSKKSKSKKRFHFDWNNGDTKFHCFNCEISGSFLKLYSDILGISIEESKRKLFSFNSQIENFKKKKNIKSEKSEINIKSQFFDFILKECFTENSKSDSLYENNLISKLINFRKIRHIPENFPLFISYKGDYKNRIIIPIFKNSHLIYFQGRAINENILPKYLNPIFPKESFIFNEENLNYDKPIIITEGIIDSLMVENSTSILGASLQDNFLEKLLKKSTNKIIICLDNDKKGIQETINISNNSKYSNKLFYFLSPRKEKDLNEIKIINSNININEFVLNNSYNLFEYRLKIKIGGKM